MSTPTAAAPAAPSSAPASTSSAPSTPSTSAPQSGVKSPNSGPTPPNTSISGTAESKADASNAQSASEHRADEIRKWKLKGKQGEVEMTESELLRRAQLGLGADETFQEASKMRKSAEALFDALKKDPIAVMKHLGLNVRDLTEGYLAKELQAEMMPPEQRELQELRDWRKQQEDTKAAADQADMTKSQQADFQQQVQRAAKDYDTKITEVLQSSNLPKTPYTVKRVAELMKNALTKGYDLDVATAVDMVREGYMGDFKALFGGLKGEQLVKFLGDDVSKEMRQFDLARIKAKLQAAQGGQPDPNMAVAESSPAAPRQSRNEAQRQMRQEEWLEHIRKKAGV